MISTIFQRFVISTFPIYTYFNVILTPGFTDACVCALRPLVEILGGLPLQLVHQLLRPPPPPPACPAPPTSTSPPPRPPCTRTAPTPSYPTPQHTHTHGDAPPHSIPAPASPREGVSCGRLEGTPRPHRRAERRARGSHEPVSVARDAPLPAHLARQHGAAPPPPHPPQVHVRGRVWV